MTGRERFALLVVVVLHPAFDGQFFTRYTFGDDHGPVVRDELRGIIPKDRALQQASINGTLGPKVTDAGEQRQYYWQVVNRPALPRDEDRPSKEELRLQVVCSTFPSWEAIGR
jgi:hypothetical protein